MLAIVCVYAKIITKASCQFLAMVVKNQLGGDFADLNETDQAILTEYNTLLAEEYQVLAKIQEQLLSEAPDADALKEYASAYVDVMDQRLAGSLQCPDHGQSRFNLPHHQKLGGRAIRCLKNT